VSGATSAGFGAALVQTCRFLKAAAGGIGGLHTKWSGFRRAGNGQLADRTPISI
jgi:hypothetical protein